MEVVVIIAPLVAFFVSLLKFGFTTNVKIFLKSNVSKLAAKMRCCCLCTKTSDVKFDFEKLVKRLGKYAKLQNLEAGANLEI